MSQRLVVAILVIIFVLFFSVLRLEREGRKQAEEIERLRAASRTRPTYDLRCPCGAPHWLDTSIPSEIWNQIAEPHELLCPLCIDDRLVKAGLTAEAEFYFVGAALTSKLYQESHGDIQAAVAAEREQWADKVEAWPNGMEYGPGVEDFVRAAVDGAIEAIKDEIAAALRAPGPTP